ncbi:MAG TPA: DUF924 family protein [Rhodanobacteraceae bacterium]|nr:DUF924 family protein [Rhodanobacteraceae bacterium]
MFAAADTVLDFWFGAAGAAAPVAERSARWFGNDPAFDATIRERFGATLAAASAGLLDDWTRTPHGRLALLIVLDQFPRNMHRGTAAAFASDARAQAIALAGLARGDDRLLEPLQRVFCYLPLEHAEDLQLQERCVDLFEALHASVPAAHRAQFNGFLVYARQHREVIARFGRFPHRNAALGRIDTPQERDYLAQPGSGF